MAAGDQAMEGTASGCERIVACRWFVGQLFDSYKLQSNRVALKAASLYFGSVNHTVYIANEIHGPSAIGEETVVVQRRRPRRSHRDTWVTWTPDHSWQGDATIHVEFQRLSEHS
jgi:hypothetical protein